MSSRSVPGFLHGALRVTLRNLVVWRSYAVASALGNFGEPILYLLALSFGLGRVVPRFDGMSYAEFIAPGLVVSTTMYTATFECAFGSYTRLTVQGSYDAILATPVTDAELVAGEVAWGALKATFGATSVLTVIALFGLVPSWLALAVVPVAFLCGAMFSAMALYVTSVSKSYDFFNYYFTLVVAPMFLFSGIFFPLAQMPSAVQTAAQLVPLTHVVELSRALVRGHPSPRLLGDLAVVIGVFAVAYAACARSMARRLAK